MDSSALKRRCFSRAAQGQIEFWALAPKGMYFPPSALPRRLKPGLIFCFFGTAQAVPFKNREVLSGLSRLAGADVNGQGRDVEEDAVDARVGANPGDVGAGIAGRGVLSKTHGGGVEAVRLRGN